MAKAKQQRVPKPAPTIAGWFERDPEAFALDVAGSIITFKNEPKAYKADREEKRTIIAESLKLLWAEFARIKGTGETINGCTKKEGWAKAHEISMRYCEYILKGKRDRSEEVRNRAMKLQVGLLVKVSDRKFPLTEQMIAAIIGLIDPNHVVREKDPVVTSKATETKPQVTTKLQQGATRKTHQYSHTGVD